jgi:RNA polymerase sigma-70 factor (family 1)
MNTLVLSAEDVYQFNQGSKAAFEKVYALYYKPLHYFIHKIVEDQTEAEDIAVDTLYKIWQHREVLDAHYKIRSFLYTTAKNASINYLKSDKRVTSNKKAYADYLEYDAHEIPLMQMRTDIIATIYNEIENLPGICKQVFKMKHIDKLPYEEIAQRLSIKPNTVASHHRRAVTLLRDMLAKREDMHLTALLFFLLFR